MNRKCGGCTLCCKLLSVRELDKPAGQRCTYQAATGCRIYRKPGFPRSCAIWNCRWLGDDKTEALRRPDRSHYVVDIMPDMIRLENRETGETESTICIQVWVDPAFPDAWQDQALLDYVEAEAQPMMVRYYSRRGFAVFPPSRSADGKWHRVQGDIVDSPSGSLLLDALKESA